MKPISVMRASSAAAMALLISGCMSSADRLGGAAYHSMSCADLNVEIGATSSRISRAAITRGNIRNTKIPSWFSLGSNAASVLADRQTARIERLQQQEAAIDGARKQQCAN